jgi:glycosyltransferase involved in cell wall biosynthesis
MKKTEDLPKIMEVKQAPRRLRIALIYSRMPFPMMRGDQLTVAHLISFLASRGHNVDLFTLDTDGFLTEMQRDWLTTSCHAVNIYPQGRLQKLFGILLGLFKGLPLQVSIFYNKALHRDVRLGILAGAYDIVYIYYLRSAEVIDNNLSADCLSKKIDHPVVSFLAMQLSQTLNTKRIYRKQKSLLGKLIYGIELNLMRRYETQIWKRFTRSVLIGPRDVRAITAECRRQGIAEIANWIYGAHGTDICRFYPATPDDIVPGRVVFSGSMFYTPNVQAILWFIEKCWPTILSRFPSAELIIQGRDPVSAIRRLNGKDNIAVTGTVSDVGAMIRSATVCINPMLAAGGMQNKLIEYFACGKAVVATPLANEGIGARPGEHFFEARHPREFAEAVLYLLNDSKRRDELGRKSRDFVLTHWTWEAHFLDLEKNFYKALDEETLRFRNSAQRPYLQAL